MRPVTIEERVISYADKFYSKNHNGTNKEKTITIIIESLKPFGADKVQRFKKWVTLFEGQ
jgi:uncharacterized protein